MSQENDINSLFYGLVMQQAQAKKKIKLEKKIQQESFIIDSIFKIQEDKPQKIKNVIKKVISNPVIETDFFEDDMSVEDIFNTMADTQQIETKSQAHKKFEAELDILNNLSDANVHEVFNSILNIKEEGKIEHVSQGLVGTRKGFRVITEVMRLRKYMRNKMSVGTEIKFKLKCDCGSLSETNKAEFKIAKYNHHNNCNISSSKRHNIKLGTLFGYRTVIKVDHKKDKFNKETVVTRCKCGREDRIAIKLLISGNANKCIKCASLEMIRDDKYSHLIGKTIGSRLLLSIGIDNNNNKFGICKCKCGTINKIYMSNLIARHADICKSCFRKEQNITKFNKSFNESIGLRIGLKTIIEYSYGIIKALCDCGYIKVYKFLSEFKKSSHKGHSMCNKIKE